ncbi:calpain-B-like [Neodiprion pinetum]|uniref:calpain-B-like n=1 Tax=Neodiprion pinetum TaxID=441929 RepID=UPI001EDD858F|nr:calpain-A-like [Neodiprion pinetum]XP_046490885.1 calpain-A-like [Neodiprion pinetum]
MLTRNFDITPNPVTFGTSLEEVEKKLDDANLDVSNKVNSTSNRRNAPLKFLGGGIFNSGDIYRHYPPKTIFKLGDKGSGLRSRGEIQDFHRLKQEHISGETLFEDATFLKPSSIWTDGHEADYIEDIEWKRPKELSDDPKFYVEGGSRFDMKQVLFGDRWLLASISSLAMHPGVLNQVVPKDQSFEDKEYAGIFHFRFWQYGRWIDVVIDDFLPTQYGKMVSSHSSTANEFWSPLLVKAYAKLYGSWNVISGGRASEAMQDFTGGIIRMYKAEESLDLFDILLKDHQRNALMSCVMKETFKRFGIFCRHAYSITKVCAFDNFRLLGLRNTCGYEKEWTGAWSDKHLFRNSSLKWKCIPESKKKELSLQIDDDGEFWMSYEDFQAFFRDIEVCYLNPFPSTDTNSKKKWQSYAFEGKWVRGVTAGGDGTSLGMFHQNPQYSITVDSPDENSDQCTVIVALMQKHRRAKNEKSPSLNFAIYPLDGNGDIPKPLTTDYFAFNSRVGEDSSWTTQLPREFTSRVELSPGSYCIVPYTTKPHDEGEFLLRVFCDGPASMAVYDEEIGFGEEGTMVSDHGLSDEDAQLLFAVFKKVSQGELEINWKQLQEMLRKDPREVFNENTCRNMVILMDELDSGKLGFGEYNALRMNIKKWKDVFFAYDADCLGYLRTSELKGALNSAGYRVNKQVLIKLVHRNQENPGKITFCEFVICALELKTMIETYQNVA